MPLVEIKCCLKTGKKPACGEGAIFHLQVGAYYIGMRKLSIHKIDVLLVTRRPRSQRDA